MVLLSDVKVKSDSRPASRTDRQTDIHFIRRILAYIVIHNGLQYNTHDSGCSSI